MVKNLPAIWETQVLPLDREDPLEKETITNSSILAWRILWTEELGRLQPWGYQESDMNERLSLSLSKTPSSVSMVKISLMFLPTDRLEPKRG